MIKICCAHILSQTYSFRSIKVLSWDKMGQRMRTPRAMKDNTNFDLLFFLFEGRKYNILISANKNRREKEREGRKEKKINLGLFGLKTL